MKDISQRFAEAVIKWRFLFIALSVSLTLFFLFCLRNLSVQTKLGDLTPQKHPYMEVQKKLMYVFGGLNQVSIALVVKEGDVFNKDTLDKVVRITRKLYLLDGVNPGRIVSLAARKIKNTRAYEDGFEVKRLMRHTPDTAAEMERLKQNIIRNPMFYGSLVSKDFKATQIMVDFEPEVTSRRIFEELEYRYLYCWQAYIRRMDGSLSAQNGLDFPGNWIDNGSPSLSGFPFQKRYYIAHSFCHHGNYLGIGCSHPFGVPHGSRNYISSILHLCFGHQSFRSVCQTIL
jgi:hypothetical protein